MSLRVLLADESDTIKKVFQLALQDLSAEIKSVHSGLDVIDVAQSFKPDIIFADVLLQKKNGYDTCAEIKQTPSLATIPVVLMWSSFMELDQDQYRKSRANDQLEKPFDADFLRSLIKKYVGKGAPSAAPSKPAAKPTAPGGKAPNPMDAFLKFPKGTQTAIELPSLPENPADEDTSEFNIATIFGDEPKNNEKTATNLRPPPPKKAAPEETAKDESWLSADLSKFRIEAESNGDNLDKFEALNLGLKGGGKNPPPVIPLPQAEPEADAKEKSNPMVSLDELLDGVTEATHEMTIKEEMPVPMNIAPPAAKPLPAAPPMSEHEMEAIIRAHTEEIIKKQINEQLFDIIEKIVREELTKVMEEEVRLKQELNDRP